MPVQKKVWKCIECATYLEIFKAVTIKKNKNYRKSKKRVSQKFKIFWNQALLQKSHLMNKQLCSPPCKILGTILESRRKLLTMHEELHPSYWGAPGVMVIVVEEWTRRHEFKSWTRLIAFHIALILLGKVWIQLFSRQLWENSRRD